MNTKKIATKNAKVHQDEIAAQNHPDMIIPYGAGKIHKIINHQSSPRLRRAGREHRIKSTSPQQFLFSFSSIGEGRDEVDKKIMKTKKISQDSSRKHSGLRRDKEEE